MVVKSDFYISPKTCPIHISCPIAFYRIYVRPAPFVFLVNVTFMGITTTDIIFNTLLLPKLAVADIGVGGGTSAPLSYVARFIAATSRFNIPVNCSIFLLSHSTSTKISNSDFLRRDGLDSMCNTFTPKS